MHTLLTTGYRKSGKDEFFRTLHDRPSNVLKGKGRTWLIFGISEPTFIDLPWRRQAFADLLKLEVQREYALEVTDVNKDEKIDIAIDGRTFSSRREVLIAHAEKRRRDDPAYFARSILQYPYTFITDWRFPIEREILSARSETLTTIRVYSSTVIPSDDETTEHQLDNCGTDFLILRSYEELVSAQKQFPGLYDEFHYCATVTGTLL